MDRIQASQVFVECVERGSITAAADALQMSRAMATRHLAQLEQWVGVRVLHRSTRKLGLTPAGTELLVHCRRLLDAAADMQALTSQEESTPQGTVRVAASVTFGQICLAPALAAYLQAYPRMRAEFVLGEQTVNLVEERIDVAIRITDHLDPMLIARPLGLCRSLVCATPEYVNQQGQPETPEELAQHNCLTHTYFGSTTWTLRNGNDTVSVPVTGNLQANDATALLEATLSGLGVTLQPEFTAQPLIESGQLVRLLPHWQPQDLGIHAVYASRKHQPGGVTALLQFLQEYFQRRSSLSKSGDPSGAWHAGRWIAPYPATILAMHAPVHVRPVHPSDYAAWLPLWEGYNAFYGRTGATALDEAITAQSWQRFHDAGEDMHAGVAELDGRIVGIVHFLFHRSTSRLADVCYLQDLFTHEDCRGRGVGRALIQHVLDAARAAGSSRVYWTTQTTNVAGRALYDKLAEHRGFIVYGHEL